MKIFYGMIMGILMMSAMSEAKAAQYDLKEMTPQVQTAISNRQARYDALQNLKGQGAVGENNQGYLAVLNGASGAADLVSGENQDRRIIYQAIVDQNALGGSGLSIVEAVFAEVQRDKSRTGDMIQLPSGEWIKK